METPKTKKMQTLEIQSGHVTTTIQADEIMVKCWLIFVKGLKGEFKTPTDIDNGLLRIGNETYNSDENLDNITNDSFKLDTYNNDYFENEEDEEDEEDEEYQENFLDNTDKYY